MASEPNAGRGRGRSRRGQNPPGWNAHAAPGSHGAGGNWRDPSTHYETPEEWVGRPARSARERGQEERTLDNPFGTEPQGWRPVDDYTQWMDRTAGPHRGRGPEGYKRSDDRIREDVCDRLMDHGGIDATGIRVKVEDGEVTLEGTVSERVEKWMAEEVADGVLGVHDVHNHLRIRRGERDTQR